MSAATPDPNYISPAGTVFQAMVRDLLAAEYDRRTKMEGRGSMLVTASASLLTVVFGLTVVVTGKDYVFDNCYAVVAVFAALLSFIVSAVLGIVVHAYGFPYKTVDRVTLERLTDERGPFWTMSADSAVNHDVKQQVTTICSLRNANEIMFKLVMASLIFLVLAISLLSAAVGLELIGRIPAPEIPDWWSANVL
ncbi:hypothetical protein [Mycobacterium terramassiliense]|uniref:hypothetical protein n=1 Tax=Mycobacterium terramassiliense TaxID=1841859 RepID=UPI0012FF5C7B|nr:hypothetical protein [Mycobacterium terramassiliense]